MEDRLTAFRGFSMKRTLVPHFYLCYNRCDHTANQPFAKSGGHHAGRALCSQISVQAAGRPAAGHRGAGAGRSERHALSGAAGRHRFGQNLYDGLRHRARAAPNTGHRAQQDAGRAALRRVSRVLSGQRGRVLCLLLRLLPAGSVYRLHRYLYRKGFRRQRGDRAPAPQRDGGAARAAGCDRRCLGVVHLLDGRPVRIRGNDDLPASGHGDGARRTDPPARRYPVRPQRHRI